MGNCDVVGVAPTVDAMEKAKAKSNTIFWNMVRSFRSRKSDSLPLE
jgi:hypothetical protein